MRKFSFETGVANFPVVALSFAFLLVAGCGPLISLGDDGPADDVYSLRFSSISQATLRANTAIHVEEPLMKDGLAATDIAVALTDGRRTTLKGLRWSANSSELVRDYVVDAVGSGTDVLLLGEGSLDIKAGCRLGLKVREFAFVPGNSTRSDRVNISIEFTLVRYADARLLGQPVLEASQPVENNDGSAIVAAFHDGMNVITGAASEWLKPLSAQCTVADD